ncbi:MAG: AarF/ABC1/UbiB kinase family protein [Pseudomonadota bacterium]
MTEHRSISKAVPVPSGRISRVSRLGSMTASVAGNVALNGLRELSRGRRPGFRDLLLTPANMRRITDDLARMRGAAMKVGQLISMDTGDVLPPELSEIMARLRADADFMPPSQLKSVLNRAWGRDWLGRFKSFDTRPVAAASIGQVHRARLRDGRDVAVKVQYPGVARSIDSDVANVAVLLKMSDLLPKGFEIDPYIEEARRQLHEEADYRREGKCLADFGVLMEGSEGFILPELYEDWTTPTVLAMSFIPSTPIEDAQTASAETRNLIAERLVTLLMRELFEFGLMQTDPNFANFRYQEETGRIVLLDFGATRRFSAEIAEQYRQLFRAGLAGDRAALHRSALEIGFIAPETLPRHQEAVIDMIWTVFDAVRVRESFDFADRSLSDRMNAAGAALARDGFLPPPVPMDVLYLQRKFGGTFLLASRLGAILPLRALLERGLEAGVS